MPNIDWGYVSGYFDGEGHVSCAPVKRGGRTRALIWYNTHLSSLEAIKQFIGCGSIRLRTKRSHQNKDGYTLTITRKADLLRVIDAMVPYLLIKGAEALRLRAYLVEHVDDTRSANLGKLAAIDSETLRRWHYEESLSFADISRRVGVTPGAVLQMMKRRGIPMRPLYDGRLQGRPKSEETKRRISATKRRAALSSATITHA
jgi:hypothetical protein